MADERLLKDKLLNNEELEQVAGGTYLQTSEDSFFYELNPHFYRTTARNIASTHGFFMKIELQKNG